MTIRALIAAMGCMLVAAAAPPEMSAAPGAWEIKLPGEPVRAVCVGDEGALVQIGHRGLSCASRLIARDRSDVTYRYDCPGRGWGQTRLHFTSPASARIDTQGIEAGVPFAHVAEARRTGSCPMPVR
jgi:hypothetical protein